MTIVSGSQKEKIAHTLDYVAEKMGIFRFEDETVQSFRTRILQAWRYKSHVGLVGAIFGITRDLGGLVKEVAVLEAGSDDPTGGIPNCPHLDINPNYYLWHSHLEESPTVSYDILSKITDGRSFYYYLGDLYPELLSATNYVEIVAPTEADLWLRSKFLVPISTYRVASEELTLREGVNEIPYHIKFGSLTSATTLLLTEQPSIDSVTLAGDYFIDYERQKIYVFDTGHGYSGKTYCTRFDRVVRLLWAPVSIIELANAESRRLMSELWLDPSNTDYESIRHSRELLELIHQCLMDDNTHWGLETASGVPVDISGRYDNSDSLQQNSALSFFEVRDNLRDLLGA